MGGFMQPQGHLQVVSNLVDCGMDPQQALEAPRFRCLEGAQVAVEPAIGQAVIEALAQLGHELQIDLPYGGFGGGQVIAIDWDEGVLQAGSDPRKDGCAMGY
ncbi:MAG: gamma-glutamyltransferase, partial [Deinococcus sp.]|nr:gamma-glutamyltransferase [Deinococcus sp.]